MTKKDVNEKNVLVDADLQSLQKNSSKKTPIRFDNGEHGNVVLGRFLDQLNTFHTMDVRKDKELEEILLKQHQYEFDQMDKEDSEQDATIPRYSPSSVSKCMRELYFKYSPQKFEKDKETVFPYHRRWQKNATYCHMRVQEDILYSSKYVPNAPFEVFILPNGLPAWEKAVARYRIIEHNGQKFALFGMCDGILTRYD